MPEYVEALSSCLLAQHWFNSVKNSSPLLLKAMYADATLDEQRKSKDPLVKMGLPYPLAPDSKVKRGPRLAQNPIYPPISCSVQDAAFQLKDVVFNPRSVLLLLESSSSDPAVAGTWWMQVQLLTHTIAQVYTSSQWRDSISKIDKDIRGFKVGMALDFGDYVLSFLTIDLVFRVFYSRSRDELPAPLYDIYLHFEKSLQVMIEWARARRTGNKKRSGPAIETIRKNTNIFVGIGVYTASEIFHHAGLLPILTESELFDSPSRFARFVSSFYSHAARAHCNVWNLVKKYIPEGQYFIAVRREDRLAYAEWLSVHGKNVTQIPKRLRCQYDELLTWFRSANDTNAEPRPPTPRSQDAGFFDLVELSYLRVALEQDHNLGDLIVGKEWWKNVGGKVWEENPLRQYFEELDENDNIELMPTYIHHSVLNATPVYLPHGKPMQTSWVYSNLYGGGQKVFWCVLPGLPGNTIDANTSATGDCIFQASSQVRDKALLSHVIGSSNSYGVGPLDYCGVAHRYHNQIVLCRHDPMAGEYYVQGVERGYDYRQHKQSGKRKVANPAVAKRKESSGKENEQNSEVQAAASAEQPAPKRRRISADRKLILSAVDNLS